MHGRKRTSSLAKVNDARRENEKQKIAEYKSLCDRFYELNNEFVLGRAADGKENAGDGPNKSVQDAFDVSGSLACTNPEMYTTWNLRRKAILEKAKTMTREDLQTLLTAELRILEDANRGYPKCYWVFNHRRWVLANIPHPDWAREMKLVGAVLDRDGRNFHAWGYRRYIVSQMSQAVHEESKSIPPTGGDSSLPAKGDAAGNTLKARTESELDFTTQKIAQSFSNYSAWHYRSKLLEAREGFGLAGQQEREPENSTEEVNRKMMEDEFELVKSAIYTDPDDQSAWLFHWWLIGRNKAPAHISLIGAYLARPDVLHQRNEGNDPIAYVLILAFNDNVKALEPSISIGDRPIPTGKARCHPMGHNDDGGRSVWACSIPESSITPRGTQQILSVTITPACLISRKPSSKLRAAINLECELPNVEGGKDAPIPIPLWEKETMNDSRRAVLEREIGVVRELLELEEHAKWPLQTLVHLLSELHSLDKYGHESWSENAKTARLAGKNECVDILERLKNDIDTMRANRYADWRTQIVFMEACRQFQETEPRGDPIPQSLMSLSLTYIPTPSFLTSLQTLNLSRNELRETTFVSSLPFLTDLNLDDNKIAVLDVSNACRRLRQVLCRRNLIEKVAGRGWTFKGASTVVHCQKEERAEEGDGEVRLRICVEGNPVAVRLNAAVTVANSAEIYI